uniref:Non-structural protein n=1 Tax=Electric ant polycipivirus 2 TaxID=3003606 RepID=A0AA95E8W7_9VIRU|nr:non-structural protein [Electric ant polycipivirus 2]
MCRSISNVRGRYRMNTTLKNTNATPVTAPRKKYDLKSQISYSLRVFKHQQNSEWVSTPIRSILTRMNVDMMEKRLYVEGQKFNYVPCNLKELVDHIRVFGTPKECTPRGKKLWMTPLFTDWAQYNHNGVLHIPNMKTTKEVLEFCHRTDAVSQRFYDPYNQAFIRENGSLSPFIMYIACLEKFLSLLEDNSLQTAYEKYLNFIQNDPEFKRFPPTSHYAFLMHLHIRGVTNIDLIHLASSWRKKEFMTNEMRIQIHNLLLSGRISTHFAARVKAGAQTHDFLLKKEAARIRAPKGMWNVGVIYNSQIFSQLWQLGVWRHLPESIRNRYLSDYTVIPEDLGRFTMFRGMGKEFAEGAGEAFEERAAAATENFIMRSEEVFARNTEKIDETVDKASDKVSEKAKGLMSEFFEKATDFTSKTAEEFSTRASGLVETLSHSMDSFTDVMKSFTGSINDVIQSFKQSCSEFIRTDTKITPKSILDTLKYYILFINVENSFLKSFLFMCILNSMGCLHMMWKYVKQIIAYFSESESQSEESQPSTQEEEGQFTSLGFSSVFGCFRKFASMMAGVFGCVVSGRVLSKLEFGSLIRAISGPLRDISWIERGITSLISLFSKFKALVSSIVEWVRLKIWGIVPEKKQFARRVVAWTLTVRYFASEAGMNAIRLSVKAREKAEKLYAEGMELIANASSVGKFPDKDLYADLQRVWTTAKTVANYCTRLKAMSQFVPSMFHIQFVGQAGVGKSRLTEIVVKKLLTEFYGEKESGSFWAYNPNVDHFDGYSGQKAMIIDDVFRYDEPKHLTALIGLITNTPVMLPMANLEDKGIQLTSDFLVTSTNKAYPRGKDIYCMEAIHRRRHMLVRVTMDPRVRNKTQGSFDETLFNQYYPGQNKLDFPHCKFSLLKPVPDEVSTHTEECVSETHAQAKKLSKSLAMMSDANAVILNDAGEVPLEVLYGSPQELPAGVQYPCVDWNFSTFILQMLCRYNAYKSNENKLSATEKITKVIDSIDTMQDVLKGDFSSFTTDEGSDVTPAATPALRKLFESVMGINSEVGFSDMSIDDIDQVTESTEHYAVNPDVDELADIDTEALLDELTNLSPAEPEPGCSHWDDQNDGIHTNELVLATEPSRLSLEEEKRRRARIMNRRGKKTKEESAPFQPLYERLKFSDNQELIRKYGKIMRLHPDFTIWNQCKAQDIDVDKWYNYIAYTMAGHYKPFVDVAMAQAIDRHHRDFDTYWNTTKSVCKLAYGFHKTSQAMAKIRWSRVLTLPDIPEIPPEWRGVKSRMPLWILQRIHEIGGEFYFQTPDLFINQPNDQNCIMHLEYSGNGIDRKSFPVPMDECYLWSSSLIFRNAIHEFFSFGITAQREILKYAKWRNSYTGFYSADALLEFYRDSLLKYPIYAYKYVSAPIYTIINFYPELLDQLAQIALRIGIIWLIHKIATLLFPGNHTSKYLHRGTPSNIRYQGKFTSCSLFNSGPLEQRVDSLFRRNVRQIRISTDLGAEIYAQALCTGQYLIFNKHCLLPITHSPMIKFSLASPSQEEEWDYLIPRSQIYEDPDGDIAIAYSNTLQMARRIDHHFLDEKTYAQLERPDSLTFLSATKNEVGVSQHQMLSKVKKISLKGISMEHAVLASGTTIVGKSGSTVLLNKPVGGDHMILGIQAWEIGNYFDSKIAIQVITKELFQRLRENLHKQLAEIPIERLDDFEDVYVPDEDCVGFTSREFNNVITIVEQEKSIGNVGKTQFKQTPIAEYMRQDGFESERVPAVLRPGNRNLAHGNKIHPLNKSLNKYFKGKIQVFQPELLSYIENSLVDYFKSKLDRSSFKKMKFEEIVVGTREDGSNPMNLKTSPGIPYVYEIRERKGKGDYFHIDEEGNLDAYSPRIKEEYEEFRSILFNGKLPLTLSYDFPKDELRPKEKAYGSVEKGTPPNTRTVTCMNMLYVMLWRELTLDMWASFHRTADGTFPFCPGINPEGPEWSNAFHYLNEHPNAVDFDVSNWDGFLPAQIAYLAGSIICRLCGYALNSPEELAIRAIITEVMYGYIQHGRIVYQKHRGIISGFPGTAELNSLCHIILIYYIYMTIMHNHKSYLSFQSFIDNVRFLVYGDDIILTISDEAFCFFHGLSIAECYTQIGYPVTSAVKDQPILQGKRLLECSFLKSTWRELSTGIWIRKMDLSVAMDLLYWERAGTQPLEQFYSNIVDSLRIVFGHGKPTYDKFKDRLNTWLASANLPPVLIQYEDLYFDHMRRYYVDYYHSY